MVEDGEVWHAFDTIIAGATQLAPWVRANVPISLQDITAGRPFCDVVGGGLAGLLRDGDTIVAHNATFDLGMVLARTARRLEFDSEELQRILRAPRFCSMRCAYSRAALGRQPGLLSISIGAEDDRFRRQREICDAADAVDEGDGVVVVTDMFGGSPSNLSLRACRPSNRKILTGMNLPMLVKLAKSRNLPVEDAVARAAEAGRRYINSFDGAPE